MLEIVLGVLLILKLVKPNFSILGFCRRTIKTCLKFVMIVILLFLVIHHC